MESSEETSPITVRVDETLRDLVPHYLENRHHDVEKLKEALQAGNFEAIRVLGHSMAGSGGGYGFSRLTQIGRELEHAGEKRDRERVERGLSDLESYLRRIIVEYTPAT